MSAPAPEHRPLLTYEEVANMTGVSVVTLRRWRRAGVGPTAVRVGERRVMYPADAVRAWLDSLPCA